MIPRALVSSEREKLEQWILRNGWAGYDPYDVRGQDWYSRVAGGASTSHRIRRKLLVRIERNLPPVGLRRVLRVKREINAKGMGLICNAYLVRFRTTGDTTYLDKANEVLAWLATNACQAHRGISWGYPFNWNSRTFIPRGTPSVVVTGTVGAAWLDHYELTGSRESLDTAEQIAEFLLHGLNRSVDEGSRLCFSYTPLDRFKVHNASLFAAAFLARLGNFVDNDLYLDLALSAVRYTLSEQNADGSFHYWGSEQTTIIDHYHTGFVLRHLDTVRRYANADFISGPLANGYAFYLERMFDERGIPKHTPHSLYPINIHSCAEALLCLVQLGRSHGGLDKLAPVFDFARREMSTAEGWYIAEIRRRWWGIQRVSIPYMRWGQAWMFLALARLETLCASE